ncbi:AAA family ATPase [Pseudomonadota bacterium DY0742]|jgi:predicted ATP-binding protein involved in virulence|uniref:AAA family ATPase n=1 Tax=Stutzerimonas balearica TaxID=74829 RepID=UPI001BC93BE7|nr:ATP-binding protein [Stutzerimonas balearica]MBS4148802.1 ATP-binding protein [Stutzerimonas balearica]
MPGHITSIKTFIPNSSKEINITLDGKNLILVGANGCGKTRLIGHLYEYLERRIIQKKNPDRVFLMQQINMHKKTQENTSKSNSQYKDIENLINRLEDQISEIDNSPVKCTALEDLIISYHENKSIFAFFEAMRRADIEAPSSASSFTSLQARDLGKKGSASSILFESYLVSSMTSLAYAGSKKVDNNPAEEIRISNWFEKLDSDLQELFEDPSLHLKFDSKTYAFHIHQKDREPYRFQQLSSGFSSILSVYADLLTKIELRSISPRDVTGIVFIDEIDAHLHVSLQKKIFRFLTKCFPNVQFIITTHSPFVVSSVDNAVIYDLTSLQQVDDLSMYSYEAILEGLFDVNPISKLLESKIKELNDLANMPIPNLEKMDELIADISPHEKTLDSESIFFLKKAEVVANKNKVKGRKPADV